jgi:predicted ABC-type ATPase
MTKDILQARVQELAKEVAESLENHNRIRVALDNATSAHNSLVGRYNEATELLKNFDEDVTPPK